MHSGFPRRLSCRTVKLVEPPNEVSLVVVIVRVVPPIVTHPQIEANQNVIGKSIIGACITRLFTASTFEQQISWHADFPSMKYIDLKEARIC